MEKFLDILFPSISLDKEIRKMSQTTNPGEVVFPIKTIRKYPNGTLDQEVIGESSFVVCDGGLLSGKIDLTKIVGRGTALYDESSQDWNLYMKWLETPNGKLYKHMFDNASGVSFHVEPVGVGTVEEGVVQKDYKLLGFTLVASILFDASANQD